MEFWPS